MAEIEIRKKSKPVWPWIIGILVIVAIVMWLIFRNDNTERDANEMGQLRVTESGIVMRTKTVFPDYVPIKLEAYLA